MERTPPSRRLQTQHAPAPLVEKSSRQVRAEQVMHQMITVVAARLKRTVAPVYRAVLSPEMRERRKRRFRSRHQRRRLQAAIRRHNLGLPRHRQVTAKARRIYRAEGLALR